MSSEGAIKPKWLFGGVFQPTTDFYELLDKHAAKVLEGVRALAEWIHDRDCEERCQIVRDLENEADTIRVDIDKKLTESFITPFDREDIYDLSQKLDEVINAAKSIVREIEAFEVRPSNHAPAVKELVSIILEGTQCLVFSIAALKHNLDDASDQAVLARKAENRVTKAYRQAVRDLLQEDDVKLIMRVKEVYSSMLTCGEKIDAVSEKLQHAIIKMR